MDLNGWQYALILLNLAHINIFIENCLLSIGYIGLWKDMKKKKTFC